MTIIDNGIVTALLVLVAVAVLPSMVTLGLLLRNYLAKMPARSAIASQRDATTPATAIRRTAAAAGS